MHTKDLIEENNRKRELLNEENEKYYTGLLIYIRTSFNRSEQETEEILMEVLDHLLEAQQNGRTAEEVFGNDPKAYAQEIVGELPTALPKEMLKLVAIGGFTFLGIFFFTTGLLSTILGYGFNLGKSVYEFHTGSLAVGVIASLLLGCLFIYGLFAYIRWSAFRKIHKWKEIAIAFLVGGGAFGLFVAGLYFMPSFGTPRVVIPVYWLIGIGAVLYGAGQWLTKKK
ncbi:MULTISPECIES: DUF1129 family protein [Paenibacillus]|uniref:DUF1129 family protein n=1 Tax=Paenibacillus campinasensis TaxID=66347 RepID=A0A268F1Z1_9BACL|nr:MULTISPECIES: DUF1129 family protein [Paenibacillus]PAD79392.1 hypothetical protein CHH67_04070 [Paenibacillus campinasensis]PAK51665.1 hypothetical protein CHH75_13930 [Paenibacillus sp. 7541]